MRTYLFVTFLLVPALAAAQPAAADHIYGWNSSCTMHFGSYLPAAGLLNGKYPNSVIDDAGELDRMMENGLGGCEVLRVPTAVAGHYWLSETLNAVPNDCYSGTTEDNGYRVWYVSCEPPSLERKIVVRVYSDY